MQHCKAQSQWIHLKYTSCTYDSEIIAKAETKRLLRTRGTKRLCLIEMSEATLLTNGGLSMSWTMSINMSKWTQDGPQGLKSIWRSTGNSTKLRVGKVALPTRKHTNWLVFKANWKTALIIQSHMCLYYSFYKHYSIYNLVLYA